MRAHQVMTKNVITVTPQTSIENAVNIMLRNHIGGVPVVNSDGRLVGIVSESDFLRRSEIGTGRKRPAWLQFFLGPGRAAVDFIRERGRKVEDVMTLEPITVEEEASLDELVGLMEKKNVKRLPVMRGKDLVGIVAPSNLLQAVASKAAEIPDLTADDDHIRDRIVQQVSATDWCPIGFEVAVRNGIVHLHGVIISPDLRRAAIVAAENVAGVKDVHDHFCFVDTYSGYHLEFREDAKAAS
ncbi:CBS domain-containing protein [Bradyrhizobium sp. ORS 86]|uniref:CBS domain-containing protein n=1 Tax=Bradyrhizobium sp. ORS 86 TaxID=1685970 RepID=UPI00388E31DB